MTFSNGTATIFSQFVFCLCATLAAKTFYFYIAKSILIFLWLKFFLTNPEVLQLVQVFSTILAFILYFDLQFHKKKYFEGALQSKYLFSRRQQTISFKVYWCSERTTL